MAAALRESWIRVLLAFFVGIAGGWYLGRTAPTPAAPVDTTSRARIRDIEAQLEECRDANARAASEAEASAKAAAKPAVAKPAAAKPAAKASTTRAAAAAPVVDLVAGSKTLGRSVKLDDLTVIEGIGPKIAELFTSDGITTWRSLSEAEVPRLQRILDAAGPRYRIHDPASWPKQAGLLADGKWADFVKLTDKLTGGR